jgi:DNA ligase D-like protein (predicted ligase)
MSRTATRRTTPAASTGLPAWVEPQLATLTSERFSSPAWVFERKLDGERCLAFAEGGRVRLMSRNSHDITTSFPEVADALAREATGASFIADGEIVAFDGDQTSFARLQHRLGVAHPAAGLLRSTPVVYYLFDVMHVGGHDVRSLPQLERKEILRGLLGFHGPLRYTEHRARDGEAYFAEACRDRWEGLIAKRGDAPYRGGRTRNWLKFKCENAQEFVIAGYTDPQGSRRGFGALLLGYYADGGLLVYAGKVGTGFTERTLLSLHRQMAALERRDPPFGRGTLPRAGVHWVEPRLVAQVGFAEWTQDGQLRHPRFQGLRTDKAAQEVVRETG